MLKNILGFSICLGFAIFLFVLSQAAPVKATSHVQGWVDPTVTWIMNAYTPNPGERCRSSFVLDEDEETGARSCVECRGAWAQGPPSGDYYCWNCPDGYALNVDLPIGRPTAEQLRDPSLRRFRCVKE